MEIEMGIGWFDHIRGMGLGVVMMGSSNPRLVY